jgi:hypothetical protein
LEVLKINIIGGKMKRFIYILMFTTLLSCNNKKSQTITDIPSFNEINKDGNHIDEFIENEEEPINFHEHIKLTNCTITTDYSVPNILNRIIGINDDDPPNGPIENNTLRYFWGGLQIALRNDIPLNENIIIIAKNSKHEFSRILNLKPMDSSYNNNILGYYENVLFENKFWLSDGNNWQFIVKSNNNILIDEELVQNSVSSMIFEKLDETPFVVNKLSIVNLHKEYTYRFMKAYTEIIVIYYQRFDFNRGYGIYSPIFYLIPNENETEEYFDIGISWNDESVIGDYHFGFYKIDELPTEEKMYAVMNFVQVR